MTEIDKYGKGRLEDRSKYLLDRAKAEFFKGKISQAAYLWEKVLESDPNNPEAAECRAYVRKNSISLRARAEGKQVDVEPPPSFLEKAGETYKRFSSTDELEWPDPEDDLRGEMTQEGGGGTSVDETADGTAAWDDDDDAVLLPSIPEIEDSKADAAESDSDSITGDFSGSESGEVGDQPQREDSFDGFDDAPTIARDDLPTRRSSAFGHVLGGVEPPESGVLPRPSTTLSGMPTSEVLPRGFFELENVDFSVSDGLGEESVGYPEEEVTRERSHAVDQAGGDDLTDDEPTRDRGSLYEREDREGFGEYAEDEPTRDRRSIAKPAVLDADTESEALLDPRKGLARAKEFFAAGRHTESLRICELIENGLPGNADVEDLVEENREMLEFIYMEKLGDLSAVPRVDLGGGEIRDLRMDHKTAFLLTRIDGMLTLEDVLSIAGMTRLETARMLVDAMEKGIVVLDS